MMQALIAVLTFLNICSFVVFSLLGCIWLARHLPRYRINEDNWPPSVRAALQRQRASAP